MTPTFIVLRKISTGGTLKAKGKSVGAVIKRMNLDPTDWEEISPDLEGDATPSGKDSKDA